MAAAAAVWSSRVRWVEATGAGGEGVGRSATVPPPRDRAGACRRLAGSPARVVAPAGTGVENQVGNQHSSPGRVAERRTAGRDPERCGPASTMYSRVRRREGHLPAAGPVRQCRGTPNLAEGRRGPPRQPRPLDTRSTAPPSKSRASKSRAGSVGAPMDARYADDTCRYDVP